MKTSDVAAHFGGKKKLAEALGIQPSAVSMWGEEVPEARQYQIQVITKGKFKVSAQREAAPSSDRRAQLAPGDRRGRRTTDPTGAEIETLRDCAEQAKAVADRLAG
jgi:DNA-binding transcriptional regulator YdaS (Cro superfamily)